MMFAGVVSRVIVEFHRDIESLRGQMREFTRQADKFFESLLEQYDDSSQRG